MDNRGIYFFIFGCITGWLLEIGFKTVSGEDKANAGMANGPFCFLYGVGTFVLSIFISKYINNIVLTFFASSVALTSCEYIGGIILDKVFGIELWDYRKLKFCINKYICLEFMIIWGVLGVVFINYILPGLNKIYTYLYSPIFILFTYLIYTYILMDYLFTSIKLLNNKKDKTL